MLRARLCFEKTGVARFISHLDLMHMLQRAFARAELPLAYTEGFNPHPYLSIARALSVGVISRCELLDFGLNHPLDWDELPARISRVLPPGVRVIKAYPAERSFQEIVWADYRITLRWREGVPEEALGRLASMLEGAPLLTMKKSKKGISEVDIRPMLRQMSLSAVAADKLMMDVTLAAGEPSLSATLLLTALSERLKESCACWQDAEIVREVLLDNEGLPFV